MTVQTVNGDSVDGTYRQVSEVTVNDQGESVERSTFAPQNTLRRLGLTKDDLDDIREHLPFVLSADHLSLYSITYRGRQHLDELDTYVFDVAPKNAKRTRTPYRAFRAAWVDDHDFAIVKTCGKTRSAVNAASKSRKAPANLTPTFVTYREQIDGKFWFTT